MVTCIRQRGKGATEGTRFSVDPAQRDPGGRNKKRTKGNACRLTPHTPPAPSPPVRGPGRGGVVGKASHVDAPKSAQS